MKTTPILALTLVGLAGAGWYAATPGPVSQLPMAATAQEAQSDTEMPQVREMSQGNPEADVTVIEYASFTCPHCRTFHETVFPQLQQDYIEPGQINFIYREVYFDRYGLWASMVARCADSEQRFFGISDLIYEQQSEWTQGGPAEIAENLRRIGRTAGLSTEQLDSCLSDSAMAEALVAQYEENAQADNIEATPSFVINGETYSNMSYDEFSTILDEELAESGSEG